MNKTLEQHRDVLREFGAGLKYATHEADKELYQAIKYLLGATDVKAEPVGKLIILEVENSRLYLWDKKGTGKEALPVGEYKLFAHPPIQPPAAQVDDWKRAVDDELVTIQSTADSFPNAKAAVKALIDWHVKVATDPALNEPKKVDEVVERKNREWAAWKLLSATRDAAGEVK